MTGFMLACSRRALLGAMVVLAFAAATAAANVQVSETRLTATASALTFRASGLEGSVVCPVTLALTLREEISLTERSLAGEVTEARVGEARCTGGMITSLTATSVRLISLREGQLTLGIEGSFLVTAAGGLVRCLYRGEAEVTNSADPITSLRSVESVTIPLSSTLRGSLTCPRSGSLVGEFTVTPEVAYTESVEALLPLQPVRPLLEFANTLQTKEMLFTNEWRITVAISDQAFSLGLLRFGIVQSMMECNEMGILRSGESCNDKISLFRERGSEPVNGTYRLTLLKTVVGGLRLER